MATAAQNAEQAVAIISCANAFKSAKVLIDQAIFHNQSLAINWLAVSASDIEGVTSASPADISNAVSTLAAVQALWAADHGGNIEKLAKPIT